MTGGFAPAERRTLGGIAVVHFVSHVHMLPLPLLFPLLHARLGLGFVELGLALTTYNIVSALTQAPVGLVVDRLGPRPMLAAALCTGGGALLLLAAAPATATLFAAAALLGLANSVYHPANYSILGGAIGEARMGRAFSLHTFAGFLGGAVAPALVLGGASLGGLAGGLVAAGLLGPLAALALPLVRPAARPHESAARPPVQALLTPAVLMMCGFFALLALAHGALANFAVAAWVTGQGLSLAAANAALTAFLLLSALGVLAGGLVADRTRRHGRVACLCMAAAGGVVLLVGLTRPPVPLLILGMGLAGFLGGMIAPSRDMLVRAAAPPGQQGAVFGIVSTGFNLGGIVGPPLFGWLLDAGASQGVFLASAALMGCVAGLALAQDRRATRRLAPA